MVVIKQVPFVTEKIIGDCQRWADESGNTYEVTNGSQTTIVIRPKKGGKKNGNN